MISIENANEIIKSYESTKSMIDDDKIKIINYNNSENSNYNGDLIEVIDLIDNSSDFKQSKYQEE